VDVVNVAIRAELQTHTQRFCLLDTSAEPIQRFSPGDSNDYVVQHDLREEGIHILMCSASYVRIDGERKYFRKFF